VITFSFKGSSGPWRTIM